MPVRCARGWRGAERVEAWGHDLPRSDTKEPTMISGAPAAEQRYRLLFAIPFHAAMTPRETRALRSGLDLFLSFQERDAAWGRQANGFARLDFSSGLLLVPGGADGAWVLECRSYGAPSAAVVHGWEVDAASVLRDIDPTVATPARPVPAGTG
jgi:hypothetical protein